LILKELSILAQKWVSDPEQALKTINTLKSITYREKITIGGPVPYAPYI